MTVVARTPATALPTPGLASVPGRSKKAGKAKSLGDSNIDLAKIYMSMGDPTTAQMLLQQVMEQGSAAEKAQAEQLMQEMV
jgi:FimV-like protein